MAHVRSARPASERRRGWTLIELLIVITIIALLASMLTGTAMKVIDRAYDAKARSEISQLSQGLADFNSRFGVFPPTRLNLSGSDAASKQFLQRCWPRMKFPPNWGPLTGATLTGDQVLVWALGGYQSGSDGAGVCMGFSDDPANPGRAPGAGGRIGPFYEFQSHRLFHVSGPGFSYIDPYNTHVPYMYFGSQLQGGYNPSDSGGPFSNTIGNPPSTVRVYMDFPGSPAHFYNNSAFQIITAGKDGMFGPGGYWIASQADTMYPSGTPGADDMANFYSTRLGAPNN